MGKVPRPKPERLREKLLQIRTTLNISQNKMLRRLGLEEEMQRSSITGYEKGEREPPLPVLLRYAQVANVYVDVLIDDGLDLPDKIPAPTKSEGVKRPTRSPKSICTTKHPDRAKSEGVKRARKK